MQTEKPDPRKNDPRLTCVSTRYKKLRRELGDAEWDGDPCAELIRTEFKHYEALLKQGVLYEPNF
jgi:hypothetical protein